MHLIFFFIFIHLMAQVRLVSVHRSQSHCIPIKCRDQVKLNCKMSERRFVITRLSLWSCANVILY